MEVVEEEGTVAELRGERVLVVVESAREETCRHCRLCFRQPDGSYQLEAVADAPVKPGDRVVVQVEQPGALTLSLVVFLVPVVALVVGMALGRHLTRGAGLEEWRNPAQALLGLGAAAVAFFGLSFYDRWLRTRRGRRPPRVVRVIGQGGEPAEGSDR